LNNDFNLNEIENVILHLNYRWNLEAYSLWKGGRVPFKAYQIYDGYEDFVSLKIIERLNNVQEPNTKTRLKHALIDHYIQRALLPHETEMRTWMRGAAADVNGRKLYLRNIIPWCHKESSFEERQIIQKETGPLCKFLRPFAVNYWNILLEILTNDLGFDNYLDYCRQKKGIDYDYYYRALKSILRNTDDLYFSAMNRWSLKSFNRPLEELNRFDAINLLGLGQFDHLLPQKNLEELTSFFDYWNIDLKSLPGLNLELGKEIGKNPQAICFILQIPDEVYILMKPEGGWVDLETLWHELGHGLSAIFTSPELSTIDREMGTSSTLTECYAFLLQNLCFSIPFLEDYLGLEKSAAEELYYYRVLKELSIFRRYAAKFIAEYEMFSSGELADGEPYAGIMARYLGFYYQPESHLFDLVPEFYSLEYVLALMAEPFLEGYLRENLGPNWIYNGGTGEILKRWWQNGNKYDIQNFFSLNGLGELNHQRLLMRWRPILGKEV